MVATRRKVARRTPGPSETRITRGEGEDGDTIYVQRPRPKILVKIFSTPALPITATTDTSSSTGDMEDITLTSPSIGDSVTQENERIPKRRRAPSIPDRALSSAVRQSVENPGTSTASGISKGGANNPIVLEEYSPRRKPASLPARAQSAHEPHKFQDRHRKLYTYRPPRPALAAKPAEGNRFTGNRGKDFYRMTNAKAKAAATGYPLPPPRTSRSPVTYDVPFEVQCPKSAHYLTHQDAPHLPYHPPYATYRSQIQVPRHADIEASLRQRAIHLIQDSKRPTHLKPLLSSDPDETSTSESERLRKVVVYQDPSDLLSPIIAQTNVLSQLLQQYGGSQDQDELREDIGMLIKVQSRNVERWMKGEKRKGKNIKVSEMTRMEKADLHAAREEADLNGAKGDEELNGAKEDEELSEAKGDEEVRELLSAGASMWQDGSTVVDVFGEEG
jgi:hypothetical protein